MHNYVFDVKRKKDTEFFQFFFYLKKKLIKKNYRTCIICVAKKHDCIFVKKALTKLF